MIKATVMKNISLTSYKLALICLPLFLLLLSSCSGYRNTANSNPQQNSVGSDFIIPTENDYSPQSWEILFRRVPGIQVMGTYPNLSLRIRGASSLNMTTKPLYVVDGIPLGHGFDNLNRATTPREVAYIQVLKGSEATIYGARGSNGVIVVSLKK